MLHLTEEKCSAAQTDERVGGIVGKRLTRCHVIDWDLLRQPAIGCDERGRDGHARQNPLEILGLEVRWACPKLLLISNQMLQKWRHQSVLRISARLQPTPRLGLRGWALIRLRSLRLCLLSSNGLPRRGTRDRLAAAVPHDEQQNWQQPPFPSTPHRSSNQIRSEAP